MRSRGLIRTSVVVAMLVFAVVAPPPSSAQSATDSTTEAQPTVFEGVDYRVYDREGRPSSMMAVVLASIDDDVLLIGEEHDDMVGHAFQTALLQAVLDELGARAPSARSVVLSLEMFERDVQYILDEYLAGMITEAHFLRSARPWPEYEGRYRPAVEVARENFVPIVAANAPRRYVNRVTNHGPQSLLELSSEARAFLPPLPYPGPSAGYRAQWDALMTAAMLGAGGDEGDESDGGDEGDEGDGEPPARYEMNPNAIYSQALWDASMGHAITEALVRHLGSIVVHFAGSFHVEKDTGIVERIADYRPGTKVTTVVMTKSDDISAWSAEEHAPLGDFVVLTSGKPGS